MDEPHVTDEQAIDERWYARPEGLPERISAGGVVARIARGIVYVALVREGALPGYVLPKGGLEAGESIEEAALREIREEAGLTELHYVAPLVTLERCNLSRELWSINHYGLYFTTQENGEIEDTENHHGMAWFELDALPDMFWPDEAELLTRERMAIYDKVIAHMNPKGRKKYFR